MVYSEGLHTGKCYHFGFAEFTAVTRVTLSDMEAWAHIGQCRVGTLPLYGACRLDSAAIITTRGSGTCGTLPGPFPLIQCRV
jgi:hypothetical protein